MTPRTVPHVVIAGSGFAGLAAARRLRRAPVRVSVIDKRNHHLFQPLLYQVASAALSPSDIAAPIRGVLRQRNVSVWMAEVKAVDPARRVVLLDDGQVPYDYLVLATGATHSFFGHQEWAQHALGLKTLEDALEIRRRVLLAFEAAERSTEVTEQQELMTFVIVGGGPTGVEMAGAFAEIARHALRREFRNINPAAARIVLVEGVAAILPSYPPELSARAQRALERLGVEVRTRARVTHIDGRGVRLGEEEIAARNVIWAAGVEASPVARSLGAPLDKAGRVLVGPTLEVPELPGVFVVGDLAAVATGQGFVPGVAPAALQQGRHAAANILNDLAGRPMRPFKYRDKGTFAVIGRGAAVGVLGGGLKLWGFAAWLAWLIIHIAFLIGFRNRLVVLLNWAYSFFTLRRGARLITFEGTVRSGADPSSPSRSS